MPTKANESVKRSREAKADRIYLRTTPTQSAVIREAAEASAQTVSSFVVDSAYARAQEVLADRRLFWVDEDRWSLFVSALERTSVPDKPRLRKLLQEPSVLEAEHRAGSPKPLT